MDIDVASKHFPKFKESLPDVSGKVFAITGTWWNVESIEDYILVGFLLVRTTNETSFC